MEAEAAKEYCFHFGHSYQTIERQNLNVMQFFLKMQYRIIDRTSYAKKKILKACSLLRPAYGGLGSSHFSQLKR